MALLQNQFECLSSHRRNNEDDRVRQTQISLEASSSSSVCVCVRVAIAQGDAQKTSCDQRPKTNERLPPEAAFMCLRATARRRHLRAVPINTNEDDDWTLAIRSSSSSSSGCGASDELPRRWPKWPVCQVLAASHYKRALDSLYLYLLAVTVAYCGHLRSSSNKPPPFAEVAANFLHPKADFFGQLNSTQLGRAAAAGSSPSQVEELLALSAAAKAAAATNILALGRRKRCVCDPSSASYRKLVSTDKLVVLDTHTHKPTKTAKLNDCTAAVFVAAATLRDSRVLVRDANHKRLKC